MPLVSVIVPAYGHANYILETLESVFQQTFQDFELIVVNDGSPDETAEVLALLISSGKIRYFEQPNQGVAVARNLGITNSHGRYIALLDDDDLWPPDKLEWQVAELESSDAVLIGGIAGSIGVDGSLQAPVGAPDEVRLYAFEDLFDGSPFLSPGQTLIRRSAFESAGGFDREIWGADDFDLWLGLSLHGPVIRRNRLALYYRTHDSNASRNLIRMILNVKKVIEKRLFGYRDRCGSDCKSRAYQELFRYLGHPLIMQIKGAGLRFPPDITTFSKNFVTLLRVFGLQLYRDVKLRRLFTAYILQRCDNLRAKMLGARSEANRA